MPGSETDRIAWSRFAGPAAGLALAGLLLAGCDRKAAVPVAEPARETVRAVEQPAAPAVPVPPPALTRADLIAAAGEAASAYAEGRTPADADPLVGRRVALRIAFGCSGPVLPDGPKAQRDGLAGWSWGPDRKTIALSMTPGDWMGSSLLPRIGAEDKWEAVEGVWLPRPWLASDACPLVAAEPLQTEPPVATPQTVGLAVVFESGSSRIGRRNGRAYETTIRAEGDAPPTPPKAGYRLVVQGHVASFPGGRAIACHATGPDQRPVCIVAIELDRVAFEEADGTSLNEWRIG